MRTGPLSFHTLSALLSGLTAVACAPAGMDLTLSDGTVISSDGDEGDGSGIGGGNNGGGESADSDGDGLSDSEEETLGTDPDSSDTDGDGWEDGEEVESNTDATDESDHPYTGGYGIDACRNDIESTGDGIGEITDNFELTDQYGDTLKLHDFCDRVVLMVSAAFW